MPSQLLTELDESEDGCAALFVEAGLPPAVRTALLDVVQNHIDEARRERPGLRVEIRYGAAVNRPQMEMLWFVVDDHHDAGTTTPNAR